MTRLVRWFAVGLLLLLFAMPAVAQVAYPPPPEKYDVHIRYRIRTDRDERIRQFKAMTAFLKEQGYEPVRRPDDDLDIINPDAESTNGVIPAAGAAKLTDEPNIRTVVLIPAGKPLPAEPAAVSQVRIRIATGYPQPDQRMLHEQVVNRLRKLGFAEAVGYDHKGFGVVRGALPAANVLKLLKDLRTLPAGWFFSPTAADDLPTPIRNVLPIRVVEVLPELAASAVTDAVPSLMTADLAAVVGDSANADKPVTVEAVFDGDIVDASSLRGSARTVGIGVTLNGVIGPVATIRLPKASLVATLAKVPGLKALRLPRAANETVLPLPDDAKGSEFVGTSRVSDLHRLGYTGTGMKVVVIGSDFEGWEKLAGKGLPKDVRFLDLTAETDPAVKPLPHELGRLSGGLPAAVAAHKAAPGAALHLVRIDPGQMHQLLTVLRAVSGDLSLSLAQAAFVDESTLQAARLRAERSRVNDEYRKAFDNLSDDPEAVDARDKARAKVKERQAAEAEYTQAVGRYDKLRAGVEALKGAEVVANTLVWEAGFPHDGQNEIGKELEAKLNARAGLPALKAAKLPPPTGWVQAAGISTGQVWAGPWLDRDGNGVMDFDVTNGKPPAGLWSKELNVLEYAALGGKGTGTLPKGVTIRVSVQWREPHDPNGFPPDGAVFPMRLRVLRQADPEGKTHASDDMIEVGRAQGEPVRLTKTRGSETFEQFVDVKIPADGVYAVRIDGGPRSEKLALGMARNLEPRIRLFVEMLDAGERAKGKVTFKTYSTDRGGVGVPGDSVAALTVASSDPADPSKVTTLTGLGPGVTLGMKPDLTVGSVVTIDGKTYGGSGVALGYAAGLCGVTAELGVRPVDLTKTLGLKPGDPLVLSQPWLSTLVPKANRARER